MAENTRPVKKQSRLNIPNLLSAYRLLALPFIIHSIFIGDRQVYITLLALNLVTDILDGLIARTFDLQTEFGARLDSIADVGTYLMAFAGMICLQSEFIRERSIEFIILIALYFAGQVVCLFRFRRLPSLHLYSSKITGYLQGIFIVTFFLWGYNGAYFYFMLVFSYLAYIEELVILLILPALRSNVKGLWHVKKEQGATG